MRNNATSSETRLDNFPPGVRERAVEIGWRNPFLFFTKKGKKVKKVKKKVKKSDAREKCSTA